MSQRKEIKRLEKDAERRLEEEEREQAEIDEEAKGRAVQDFERVQAGLEAKLGAKGGREVVGRENGKMMVEEAVEDAKGTKRKFELDEDELMRIAREDRMKIRKAIDDEKVGPSLWMARKLLITKDQFEVSSPFFLGTLSYTVNGQKCISYETSETPASLPSLEPIISAPVILENTHFRSIPRRKGRQNW